MSSTTTLAAVRSRIEQHDPSLRSLELNGLDPAQRLAPGDLARMIKGLECCERVHLAAQDFTPADGNAIASLIQSSDVLQTLSLPYSRLGDAGFLALGSALMTSSSLRSLDLSACESLTPAGARALLTAVEAYRQLTSLRLESVESLAQCEAELANIILSCTALRVLDLRGCSLPNAASVPSKPHANLRSLDLSGSSLEGARVAELTTQLRGCPALTSLSLSRCGITSGSSSLASFVAQSRSLLALDLSHNPSLGLDDWPAALYNNTALVQLDFTNVGVTAESMSIFAAAFSCHPRLKAIKIGENPLGNEGAICLANALSSECSLTSVVVASAGIGVAGGVALAHCLRSNLSLVRLDVRGNPLLAERERLAIKAGLDRNRARSKGDAHAVKMHSLLEKLTSMVAADSPLLTEVRVDSSAHRLTGPELASLFAALRDNTHTRVLDLGFHKLGGTALQGLCTLLSRNTGLRELRLDHTNLGAEGAKMLGEALATQNNITSLNVSGNGLHGECLSALCAALGSSTSPAFSTLRSLTLSLNSRLGSDIKGVANALAANCALTSLRLSGVGMKSEGLALLTAALEKNTNLKSIDLSCNALGDDGAILLAALLLRNRTVQSIDVSFAWIGERGGQDLAQACVSNRSLLSLEMEGNDDVPQILRDDIAACLMRNAMQHKHEAKHSRTSSSNSNSISVTQQSGHTASTVATSSSSSVSKSTLPETRVTQKRMEPTSTDSTDSTDDTFDDSSATTTSSSSAAASPMHASVTSVLADLRSHAPGTDSIALLGSQHVFTPTEFESFAHACTQAPQVRTLALEGQDLSAANGRLLAALLSQSRLTSLRISSCNLGNKGAAWLAAVLPTHKTLSSLHLEDEFLSVLGIQALCASLETNSVLVELELNNNHSVGQSVEAVASLLLCSQSIQRLSLRNVGLNATRLAVLVGGLENNAVLRSLDLSSNPIGDDGSTVMGEMLSNPSSARALTHLLLPCCSIGPLGGSAIVRGLESNEGIVHVDVSGNDLTTEQLSSIRTILERNAQPAETSFSSSASTSSSTNGTGEASPPQSSLSVRPAIPAMKPTLSRMESIEVEGLPRAPPVSEGEPSPQPPPPQPQQQQRPAAMQHLFHALLQQVRSNHSSLHELSIHRDELSLTAVHVQALASALELNTHVRTLDLSNQEVGDSGCEVLCAMLRHNASIAHVSLSSASLRDGAARSIASLLSSNPRLEVLEIGKNDFTAAGLQEITQFLGNNTTLRALHIPSTPLLGSHLLLVASLLQSNCSLRVLDLSHCALETDVASWGTFVHAMGQATCAIEELNLGRNSFGSEEAGSLLVQMLANSKRLLSLDVSSCALSASTVRSLCCALRGGGSCVLRHLKLSGNEHVGECIDGLASALSGSSNSKLELLHLSACSIGSSSMGTLCMSLRRNTHLALLNVSGNKLMDEGAHALAALIEVNSTLTKLDASSCEIGESGGKALASAMRDNHSLVEFNLQGNALSAAQKLSIDECIERNVSARNGAASEQEDESITGETNSASIEEENSTEVDESGSSAPSAPVPIQRSASEGSNAPSAPPAAEAAAFGGLPPAHNPNASPRVHPVRPERPSTRPGAVLPPKPPVTNPLPNAGATIHSPASSSPSSTNGFADFSELLARSREMEERKKSGGGASDVKKLGPGQEIVVLPPRQPAASVAPASPAVQSPAGAAGVKPALPPTPPARPPRPLSYKVPASPQSLVRAPLKVVDPAIIPSTAPMSPNQLVALAEQMRTLPSVGDMQVAMQRLQAEVDAQRSALQPISAAHRLKQHHCATLLRIFRNETATQFYHELRSRLSCAHMGASAMASGDVKADNDCMKGSTAGFASSVPDVADSVPMSFLEKLPEMLVKSGAAVSAGVPFLGLGLSALAAAFEAKTEFSIMRRCQHVVMLARTPEELSALTDTLARKLTLLQWEHVSSIDTLTRVVEAPTFRQRMRQRVNAVGNKILELHARKIKGWIKLSPPEKAAFGAVEALCEAVGKGEIDLSLPAEIATDPVQRAEVLSGRLVKFLLPNRTSYEEVIPPLTDKERDAIAAEAKAQQQNNASVSQLVLPTHKSASANQLAGMDQHHLQQAHTPPMLRPVSSSSSSASASVVKSSTAPATPPVDEVAAMRAELAMARAMFAASSAELERLRQEQAAHKALAEAAAAEQEARKQELSKLAAEQEAQRKRVAAHDSTIKKLQEASGALDAGAGLQYAAAEKPRDAQGRTAEDRATSSVDSLRLQLHAQGADLSDIMLFLERSLKYKPGDGVALPRDRHEQKEAQEFKQQLFNKKPRAQDKRTVCPDVGC